MTYEIIQEQVGRTRCDIRAEGCICIRPDGAEWGTVVFQLAGAEVRLDACPSCMGATAKSGPGIRERLESLKHPTYAGDGHRTESFWELFKFDAEIEARQRGNSDADDT